MSYQTFLEARGYTRVIVHRTEKQPGDLVLANLTSPVERVPEETRVVSLRKRAAGGSNAK